MLIQAVKKVRPRTKSPPKGMGDLRPSEKSRWDFSDETSALPALTAGKAVSSHSCADRSIFCPGKAGAKNGFQKPASRAIIVFRQVEVPQKAWGTFLFKKVTPSVSRVLSRMTIYLAAPSPVRSSRLNRGAPSRRVIPRTNRRCIG